LTNGDGKYFYKATKYGYKYSPYDTGGKCFVTEKEAKTFHNKMKIKEKWEIETIHKPNRLKTRVRIENNVSEKQIEID